MATAASLPLKTPSNSFQDEQCTKLVFTEQGVYFDGPEAARGREAGTFDVLGKLGEELDRNG